MVKKIHPLRKSKLFLRKDLIFSHFSADRRFCQRASPVLNMRVGGFDCFLAVFGFETFDDEVAAGHVLEMVDEQDVDSGAGGRADDGERFGGGLFGDDDAETGGDGADEAGDRRRGFIDDAAAADVRGGVAERLAECGADGPVAAFAAII